MTAPVDLDALERLRDLNHDEELKDALGKCAPALIAELRAARRDAVRLAWIIENAPSLLVHSALCAIDVRAAIDAAIAKGTP